MYWNWFDLGARRSRLFYIWLTVAVMAGICLMIVPETTVDAVTGLLGWRP